jgi:lipoic acid synthetase
MTAATGRARSFRVRWLGRVRYRDADALMHALAERSADDHLLLVEHPPTYTLGVRADPAHVLVPPSEVGAELVRADRGGDVTYHGPGQLVAYPVLTLPGKGTGDQPDTVAYVGAVEQLIIDTLADLGLPGASRLDGYPGVWLGVDGPTPRKIAAIGVRIKRGRTLHGLALNVHPDLAMFGHIVPCGIPDKAVTSLAAEGVPATMREVADALVARATARWGAGLTVERADLAWRAPQLAACSTAGSAGAGAAQRTGSEPAISPQRQARLSEAGVTEGLQIAARKPEWARAKVRITPEYLELKRTMRDLDLTTVCEEAGCPNIFECWAEGTGTFMINGERCTRACGFCLVDTSKPLALDPAEPDHVADAVARMGLSYAVVTCVARDDLPDGGAVAFAATIHAIRGRSPEARVEVLISDCKGDPASLDTVFAARPDVLNHNIETVLRLQRAVRPSAGYARSLAVLARAKAAGLVTKSSLMVGIGETDDEVAATFADLHAVGVDIVTVGQYLRPTAQHLPVSRWVTPEQFERFRVLGEDLGIPHVESSPLTRSSHHAAQAFERVTASGRMASADAATRP